MAVLTTDLDIQGPDSQPVLVNRPGGFRKLATEIFTEILGQGKGEFLQVNSQIFYPQNLSSNSASCVRHLSDIPVKKKQTTSSLFCAVVHVAGTAPGVSPRAPTVDSAFLYPDSPGDHVIPEALRPHPALAKPKLLTAAE
jgi:hypothetical protein